MEEWGQYHVQDMLNAKGFHALTHIYDAAIHLGRWRRALDATAQAIDAKAMALIVRNPDRTVPNLQLLSSPYLKFGRTPSGLYYGLRLNRLQDAEWDLLSKSPVHSPTPDTSLGLTRAEIDARPDYALLRKKVGVGRRFGVRLNADKAWFDGLTVGFDAQLHDIPATALSDVIPLLPHLTKAVEIGRTFAALKARYRAALGALDRVRTGMAIALPTGEIIVENEEASRIFGLADGLTKTRSNLLTCDNATQSAQLAQAVQEAANTARGERDTPECLIAVQRPSGLSPFLVDVSPLKDSRAEIDTALEGALVTVIDPDRVPYLRTDRFAALYDLTAAETEVCRLIIQGHSVNEIADIRSTTPTTAKNQVAAVLGKIGVSRRLALIRLVIRVLPPVE